MLQAYRDTIGKMAKIWRLPRDPAAKRLGINKLDDPIQNLGWKRLYFSDPETDWVLREVRVFVPPTVNMIYVRCGLVGTGQVVFDDASLRGGAGAPGSRRRRRHGTCSWTPASRATATTGSTPCRRTRASGSTGTRRSSTRAGPRVRYSSGAEGLIQARAGACQVLGREVAGKHLRLSAWVKTDSLKLGGAYLRIYCNSLGRGMLQSDPGESLSLTHDWTKLSVELDVPEDAYVTWAWLAYTAPATGLVWYDDASLEVLGPARGRDARRPGRDCPSAEPARGAGDHPAPRPSPGR